MLILRAVFWVVLVSFALTGGDYERAAQARGFAAPARHAAASVVETVAGLRTLCADHLKVCEGTRGTFASVRGWGENVAGHVGGAWKWTGRQFKWLFGRD